MFKIGDKVRLRNRPKWKHGDGEITKANTKMGWFNVRFNTSGCVVCEDENCGHKMKSVWVKSVNIERVVVKNEQLLFNFMK